MTALMGITWIFGFLLLIPSYGLYTSFMSWLFAVCNSTQVSQQCQFFYNTVIF